MKQTKETIKSVRVVTGSRTSIPYIFISVSVLKTIVIIFKFMKYLQYFNTKRSQFITYFCTEKCGKIDKKKKKHFCVNFFAKKSSSKNEKKYICYVKL